MIIDVLKIIVSNIILLGKRIYAITRGTINISPIIFLSSKVKFQLINKGSITIGGKSRIEGQGLLRASAGTIEIGERCEIRDVKIQANKGKVVIESGSFFNSGCIITCCESIDIGEGCAFGTNVSLYDHDHVYVREGQQPWNMTKSKPIKIGNNCWIGANVLILRGTEIGDNCVIAGGSVVKGIIPAHSLVRNNRELIIQEIK